MDGKLPLKIMKGCLNNLLCLLGCQMLLVSLYDAWTKSYDPIWKRKKMLSILMISLFIVILTHEDHITHLSFIFEVLLLYTNQLFLNLKFHFFCFLISKEGISVWTLKKMKQSRIGLFQSMIKMCNVSLDCLLFIVSSPLMIDLRIVLKTVVLSGPPINLRVFKPLGSVW